MDIDVGAYIGDLLYEFDSVAVAGLGGFVTGYKPAFADQVQGELHPPAKNLQFNSNLVMDDGLLAQYIRDKHQISLSEAQKAVTDYVQSVQEAINRREIVVLPKVGRLYKDYEQNLQFLADGTNFNTDSYGLPIVHFYPVSRADRASVKQATAAPKAPRVPQPGFRAFLSRIFGNGMAGIIAFVALVAVVAVYFLFFHNRSSSESALQTPPSSRVNVSPSTVPADSLGEDDDLLIEDSYIGENDGAADFSEAPDSEAPTTAPGQRYFIISLGVFGNEKNVENLIKKVYEAGYEPYTEKVGKNTRVGIQKAYNSASEIEATLKDVLKKGLANEPKVVKR
ncbi:MAG: hypothetical protein KDC66_07220 [Phaeodactylibacter sp.]|nr:hypothetical protein [Phaeodactylibacter sp.]MCB9276567.1 hypothetical protein [Lewinellaceae bacterium]